VGQYDPSNGNGSNGYIVGALKSPHGIALGARLPIRECNIKRYNATGVPAGLQQCSGS
jgi:hypothetical protein